MNYKLILKSIGNVLRIEALFMLIPLVVSFIYGDGDYPAEAPYPVFIAI